MRDSLYLLKMFFIDLFRYPALKRNFEDYNDYWKEKKGDKLGLPNPFQRKRAEWISNFLLKEDRVSDLACGDGAVLFEILKKVNIQAVGIDISDVALSALHKKGVPTIKIDTSNLANVEGLPNTDYFLALEILEHTADPESLLDLLLKKSNKGVFISFPNTGYIQHRLRLLLGSFPLQWRIFPGEHLRFWTLRDLKWWLRELNLTDKSIIHCYEGIPILNKLWPSLFAKALIIKISKNRITNI